MIRILEHFLIWAVALYEFFFLYFEGNPTRPVRLDAFALLILLALGYILPNRHNLAEKKEGESK